MSPWEASRSDASAIETILKRTLSGRRVELTVLTRRFWCDAVLCGRRIFYEQFGKGVLARYGRRTQRLETIVHHLEHFR